MHPMNLNNSMEYQHRVPPFFILHSDSFLQHLLKLHLSCPCILQSTSRIHNSDASLDCEGTQVVQSHHVSDSTGSSFEI